MRRSVRILSVLSVVVGGAAACGGAMNRAPAPEAPKPAKTAAGCERLRPGTGAMPVDAAPQGSTVALARLGDRTIAYVADEDDATVHTVDVESQTELSTTTLAGAPSQLLVAKDGRIIVALRDKAALEVLEPGVDVATPLEQRCVVPTAVEPVGLAMTPDDGMLLVSSGWGGALGGYESTSLKRIYELRLPKEPRAVVVSDDGQKAFVAHVVGSQMSVVDLAERRVRSIDLTGTQELPFRRTSLLLGGDSDTPRRACQGFALAKAVDSGGRIFAPQVLVDPGDTEAPSGGYGGDGFFEPEVGAVAVIDAATDEPLEESITVKQDIARMGGGQGRPDCLLPRAAAVDTPRGALFVTCMGIDAVLELDARAADPKAAERRRWSVASGPTGIAVDAKSSRALVWSQFDRTLQVIPLGPAGAAETPSPAAQSVLRVALSRKAGASTTHDLALGRKLFYAAGDARISRDGRACASCHPDGREDSLTWSTPDGPRQTPMLAGRLHSTAPYGWNGAGEDIEEHLSHTFERLGGSGLPQRELQALIAFATSMPAPAAAPRDSEALIARGSEIFHSSEAGCVSCHVADGTYTDHAPHDVRSRTAGDGAAAFDTPSLRFVGGTAPYFHDGRYPTLRALLLDSDGKMGRTSHLSKSDLDALEAYMRSL